MPYTSQYSLEKDCSVNDQPDCADAKPTVPFTGLTCTVTIEICNVLHVCHY